MTRGSGEPSGERKRRIDARTAKLAASKADLNKALIEVLVFSVFLVVTTILALSCQNIQDYYMNESFIRLFVLRPDFQKFVWNIDYVYSMETFWDFIQGRFLGNFNKILIESPKTNDTLEDPYNLRKKKRFWGTNIVVNAPRLRQIRVKPQKCKDYKFLLSRNKYCYGKYSIEDQEDAHVFKETPYKTINGTDMRTIFASTQNYYGGGYFVQLDLDKSIEQIQNLIDTGWVDSGTRAVMLDVETYNFNLHSLYSIRLIVEVLPSGTFIAAFDMECIPANTIWSSNDPETMISAIVFYLIVMICTVYKFYEMIKLGCTKYWKIIWNYIDWGVIITAYISFVLSLTKTSDLNRYFKQIGNGYMLASMDTLIFYDDLFVGALAVCTMQVWIRTFRFISFNQTMLNFNIALKSFIPDIFGFSIILIIAFMTFALSGMLAFGDKHPDFTSFMGSFFFMFRLMLHDFDYQHFDDVDPLWGPIYILSYIIIIIFILLNMFLAIISSIYSDVKLYSVAKETDMKQVFTLLWKNLKIFLKYLCHRKKPERREPSTDSKKIKFTEAPSDDESIAPRELEKDEALKEYFGVGTIEDDAVSESSYKSIEFDEDGKEAEAKQKIAGASETSKKLTQRLDKLEMRLKLLDNDYDNLAIRLQ